MRAVLQRTAGAAVAADGETTGEIGAGLLILLGVARGDTGEEAGILAKKIAELRIFEDETGKLNRSLLDTGGGALVVSNFTLSGNCRRGRRPDFAKAAPYEEARALYERFVKLLSEQGVSRVRTGSFGADMEIRTVLSGPVTIVLDTDELR